MKQTNMQPSKEKEARWPVKPKSVFAQWNPVTLLEIKKIIFNSYTYEHLT
jgi:hypothetical protein